MKLRKSAHTVYKTQYHIVWITRYRRKILVKGVKDYLKIKLLEIRKYYPEWEYLEIGIDLDHVHLYMVIPPKYAVSKVVETIKSNTSKALKIKFAFLEKVGILGWQRDMGKRLFCLYGKDKRKDNQRIRKNAREGRYRTSGAWILKAPRL
jgi:REP element-mobilizing transposase RayT